MPLYTFEARDGSTVERYHEISDAPRVGKRIRVNGKTYRRVFDYGRRGGEVAVEKDWDHLALALTPEQAKRYCTKFDDMGHGRLRSRKEIQEVQARMQADGVPMRYDFGIHGQRGKKL